MAESDPIIAYTPNPLQYTNNPLPTVVLELKLAIKIDKGLEVAVS